MPATPRDEVIESIVRVLAPYIGENMARASVRGNCDKLGLGARLEENEIEKLVAALSLGLSVFVGREKAELLLGDSQGLAARSPQSRHAEEPAMKVGRVILPYLAVASAIRLPKLALGDTALYTRVLSGSVLDVLSAGAKVASLFAGAVFAGLSAARLERDNPARPAWTLFSAWLAAFGAGQIVLSTYSLALGRAPPLPSAGDALFLLGYAMMILGLLAFIRVYRAAGFAIGGSRELTFVAFGGAGLASLVAYPVLLPIAATPQPFGELAINMAYPLLDFATLIPTLVLLWITRAFRGGKVWSIWATLLASILFMAAGDVLFGYVSSIGKKGFEPLVDLMFIMGYFLAASGAKLQHELLTE